MGKNLLFAFLGVAIIVTFILLVLQEGGREWKAYQRDFRNMAVEIIGQQIRKTSDNNEGGRQRLKRSLADESAWTVEIQQIYLKDLDVIDRCTTCHLGINDQRWSEAPQPFTSHTRPVLSLHSPSKFGCTVCHLGQGLATTTKDAHGQSANWGNPLLPPDYIEASCSKCHANLTFREAPVLDRGKYLVARMGCLGCHQAKGFSGGEKIGPRLDWIKFKTEPEWISRFLKEPKSYSKETRMPDFKLKEDEIQQIREFLLSLAEKNGGNYRAKLPQVDPLDFSPEEMEKGKQLVKELACTTCHTIKGIEETGFFQHDKPGPDLSKVGSKLKADWLQLYLKDPSVYQPGSRMPTYRLEDKEIREVSLFLLSLKEGDKGELSEVNNKERLAVFSQTLAIDQKKAEQGKLLVSKYNCVGCHDIQGINKGEKGPDWDGIASRPIGKFDFGNNPDKIERSRSAWIKTKIMKPRAFRDSLKMPQLDISEEDAVALTTLFLSLTDKKIPDSYLVEDQLVSKRRIQIPMTGPVGNLWKELKCLQCHTVGGSDIMIGPDLAFEGSRVKREWMVQYLKKPGVVRPISAARMPDLKLSEREAELLSDFIDMSLVDNNLPVNLIREEEIPGKSLKLGKKLFSRKYGCIGCHEVEGKGGKIGPEVSKLGKRLEGDWIYAYLKNPQSAIPGAMMPNFALTDEEAKALTEYLLSLEGKDLETAEMSK